MGVWEDRSSLSVKWEDRSTLRGEKAWEGLSLSGLLGVVIASSCLQHMLAHILTAC